MLDEILTNNQRFLEKTTLPRIGHAPRKQTALVTCMDCRLVNMFEEALGLERGDVLELRTAGATIPVPERAQAANDLIRSLAIGIYFLGVREVLVVGGGIVERHRELLAGNGGRSAHVGGRCDVRHGSLGCGRRHSQGRRIGRRVGSGIGGRSGGDGERDAQCGQRSGDSATVNR